MAVTFAPLPGVEYLFDYEKFFGRIARGEIAEQEKLALWRHFLLNDLWLMLFAGFGIQKAHHAFVVRRCREFQEGPKSHTLDIWARYHWKSTIITQAETIQHHLRHPDHCTAILAYARPAAKKFLRGIKVLLEESVFLKQVFPEVLWANPSADAPKWSEDDGLVFRRSTASRGESTIEAWGLIEGMPTGRHFERLVFDDIETEDLAANPDQLDKCFSRFDMAVGNLGTGSDSDIVRVIGTYYSHFGPMVRIGELKYPSGGNIYTLRKIPATDDGTKTGQPILIEPLSFEKLKSSLHFNSQQLCDPTPQGDVRLSFAQFLPIHPRFLPKNRIKFLLIDPAGDDAVQKGSGNDPWAMVCVSVEPCADELGNSRVFIEDGVAEVLDLSTAVDAACNMYIRNGRIRFLGIEKTANDTTYTHIMNALRARKRHTSIRKTARDGGNVVLLSPANRTKARKVESALSWPLNNGKLHYSEALSEEFLRLLQVECDKFPFYHVNILDALSYLWDLLQDPEFWFDLRDEWAEDDEDEQQQAYVYGDGTISRVGGY